MKEKSKMKKILLILSFLRASPKAVQEALHLAKERNAELIVFFVLDLEYSEKIVHKLTDEGWIGGRPSESFFQSLLKEYQLQAETKIREVEHSAREMNIPVRSMVRTGAILEETLRITAEENPDLILITRRKRSDLSRLIFGSLAKTLQKEAPCEVKIIDSD